MTRQQDDVLSNNGRDYYILEVEGGDLYRPPETCNIVSMSSACWRGYQCKYSVSTENGNLVLTDLEMRTEDNVYPQIDGVDPVDFGVQLSSHRDIVSNTCCLGAIYHGLNISMSHFSGRIMLGENFLSEVNTFDATSYQNVLEIHVQQGRVVQAIDLSEEVASQRRSNQQSNDSHPYSWKYEEYLREKERHPDLEDDDDDL